MGRPWTSLQETILEEYARKGLGAEGVQQALEDELGVERSISSIVNRAHDLAISLDTFVVCPMCGRHVKRLNYKSHICMVCAEKENLETAREVNRNAYKQIRRDPRSDPEYVEMKRRTNRVRKNTSRAKEKQ